MNAPASDVKPEFLASDKFIVAIEDKPADEFIPKIFALAYDKKPCSLDLTDPKRIEPIRLAFVAHDMMENGNTKNAVAKLVRMMIAECPLSIVCFVSEVWHRRFTDDEMAKRVDEVESYEDKDEALMIVMHLGKEKMVAMHKIAHNPKRFLAEAKLLSNATGRFA